MNGFRVKCVLAQLFQFAHISEHLFILEKKRYKNNYIRVINYHDTKVDDFVNFEKQVNMYKNRYINVTYSMFEDF